MEVIQTSPKWHDVAEMNIDQGDSIQNSYEGELDGKMGYLLLSKRKLLFVREEGFLRKSYDLSLDLPYDDIEEFSLKGRYELKMTDVEGREHGFRSFEVLAKRIEERLENLSST